MRFPLPHGKKSASDKEEGEMHAIVQTRTRDGLGFCGKFLLVRPLRFIISFSLSHSLLRYVFMLLAAFVSFVVAFFVFLSRSIYRRLYFEKTHCQKDKGESFASFLFGARLCWYVQKKERNTFRNEIAQEHVQWGKIPFFFVGKFSLSPLAHEIYECRENLL